MLGYSLPGNRCVYKAPKLPGVGSGAPSEPLAQTLQVLLLGSGLTLLAEALRRSHPEMTTWLVRLTVLL